MRNLLRNLSLDRQTKREVISRAYRVNAKTGRRLNTWYKLQDTLQNAGDSCFPVQRLTRVFKPESGFRPGDHLYVQRAFYTHHGLYWGEGQVIHYFQGKVIRDSLFNFAAGAKIWVKSSSASPAAFSPEEIVQRAESRLGENEYHLIFNNCEHFVRWCRNGLSNHNSGG